MNTTPQQPEPIPSGIAGVAVFAALAADLEIPALTGLQAQGDLLVLPWPAQIAPTERAAAMVDGQPIPAAGIPVLAGRTGHTHVLHAAGPGVTWTAQPSTSGLTLGTLTVPHGALAVLGHDEHPDLHIGPGVYALRRQHAQTLPATTPPPTTTTRPQPAPAPAPAPDPEPGPDDWRLDLD